MKITVGGRDLIEAVSLAIPPNEDAWVEFDAEGWRVKVRIFFSEDASMGDKSGIKVHGLEDRGEVEFVNWDSTIGMSFDKPIELARHNNKKIVMIAHGALRGKLRVANIGFYWESIDG